MRERQTPAARKTDPRLGAPLPSSPWWAKKVATESGWLSRR
jgi:hypothetical protein